MNVEMMDHEGSGGAGFNHHGGAHSNHEVEEMSMDNNNHDHSMAGMMMKMYFHFGLGDTLLFPGLVLDSSLKLILSCLVLFILAIFLEALNYLRRIRCECELKPLKRNKNNSLHDHEELTGNEVAGSCCQKEGVVTSTGNQHIRNRTRRCCSVNSYTSNRSSEDGLNGCSIKHCEFSLFNCENRFYKLAQAFLYLFQTGLALTLMLAAMTYNICIIFAIVMGAGVGYYVFYRPIVDVEVCH